MTRRATVVPVLALLLAGCASTTPGPTTGSAPTGPVESVLASHGLDGMSAPELVDHLDRLGPADRPTDLTASVRPDEVLVSDGRHELSLEIPDDLFYLSVAPYAEQTHDCFFHSLTTCQGELAGEDVTVRIVDATTGEVLVDETVTTFDNGFVGFWLPRDIDATVAVDHDGRTGSAAVSTTDGAATCLTTLQVLEA